MAEEQQRCGENRPRLCRNNCGFFGNPATLDLCSKCYRSSSLNKKSHLPAPAPAPAPSSPRDHPVTSPRSSAAAVRSPPPAAPKSSVDVAVLESRPKRCAGCRRKVGLAGFRCRCGSTYCGVHRYPEAHACRSYDYRKAGREEIARANPVVKADKLERI